MWLPSFFVANFDEIAVKRHYKILSKRVPPHVNMLKLHIPSPKPRPSKARVVMSLSPEKTSNTFFSWFGEMPIPVRNGFNQMLKQRTKNEIYANLPVSMISMRKRAIFTEKSGVKRCTASISIAIDSFSFATLAEADNKLLFELRLSAWWIDNKVVTSVTEPVVEVNC